METGPAPEGGPRRPVFKIGEFSKIAQVSLRMLRHWDAVGLFRPAHVDPDTGYRYYAASQLPEVNRIVALRGMGFGLEEIGALLAAPPAAGEVRSLFERRRREIEREIERGRWRLALVESRLEELELSEAHPDAAPPEVLLKPVPRQHYLSLREPRDREAALFERVLRAVDEAALEHRGPALATFWGEGHELDVLDWELGFVMPDASVEEVVLEPGRALRLRTLPGEARVAAVTHRGPYVGLHRPYGALGRWIEANGWRIAGPEREVFWEVDRTDPERNVTEVQFPVAPR